MVKLFTLILTTIILTSNLIGQQDTEFWFAAPNVSSASGDIPISLNIMSYGQASNVTISQPSNLLFIPITLTLPPASSQVIDLSPFLSEIESPSANTINNNGLKITATQPISAYYELSSLNNKELFSLKGKASLGTNFYTPFQNFSANNLTTPASFSSFEVVATMNNTTVLITPRTAITGHSTGATFSVVLNAGQTYTARDFDLVPTTSLSGSIVASNKPVAVTVFEGGLINGGCTDLIGDQITSTMSLGKKYVVQKGEGLDERIFILATENGTNITFTNSTVTNQLINAGETVGIILLENLNYVVSNKPIYLLHVSGSGCQLSSSQLPNAYCAGSYEASFRRTSADSLGLILYTRSGFENQFAINGNSSLINPLSFNIVPGSGGELMAAKLFFNTTDIPVNTHITVTNSGDLFGLNLVSGMSSNGSSSAYITEFSSLPFALAGSDDTVCSNVGFPINGTIGGGPITGSWSSSGFGNFSNSVNSLINTYVPSPLDNFINPVKLILTSTGVCAQRKDTLLLVVSPKPNVNASADQTVCANNSLVQLNGSISGGANQGTWTTTGTGTFPMGVTNLTGTYLPSAADISSGTITMILTSTFNGSCLAETDTMKINITPPPFASISQDTILACVNNASFGLSGTVSGATNTGKWTSTGTGIFNPNNVSMNPTYQPSVQDLAAGTIMIYLESTSNGNCFAVKDSVKIIFTVAPTVEAGVNQLICSNNATIQLAGVINGASSTGIWTGGLGQYTISNTQLNSIYKPTLSEISSGNLLLTLTATNFGNCNTASDVLQIIFVAPPLSNFTSTDNCLNKLSAFNNSSLPGYGSITNTQWNFGDGGTSTISAPTHFYAGSGTYNVELIITNSNGCKDTVIKPITIFELPVSNFSYNSNCNNNVVTFNFTDISTSTNPITQWFYDFGGQAISNLPSTTQSFVSAGNYLISHIVTTSQGCKDTLIQTIQISPLPSAGFSYNSNNGLNVGAVFNFIDTSDYATSFLWNFGGDGTTTLNNPSHTFFENGTYLITQYVYNDLGCSDSSAVLILINTVTDEISTLIPNAISPNGDGVNDVWKLGFINLLFPDATVTIVNQWGQELFYSEGYSVPWDGRYNGELVPDGNYFFVIDLKADVKQSVFKGVLLVLKSRN